MNDFETTNHESAAVRAAHRTKLRSIFTDEQVDKIMGIVFDERTEPRLGQDYYLGCFIHEGRGRFVRLVPGPAKIDEGGEDALREFMNKANARKFFLVPVVERGDAVVAMKEAIAQLEHLRATAAPEE